MPLSFFFSGKFALGRGFPGWGAVTSDTGKFVMPPFMQVILFCIFFVFVGYCLLGVVRELSLPVGSRNMLLRSKTASCIVY